MIGHAELLDRSRETEIEVRKVDEHQRLGFLRVRGVHQPVEGRERFRQHADRFDEARHAEAAVVREQLSASRHQPLSAKAKNGGVGLPAANFNCEGAGV